MLFKYALVFYTKCFQKSRRIWKYYPVIAFCLFVYVKDLNTETIYYPLGFGFQKLYGLIFATYIHL